MERLVPRLHPHSIDEQVTNARASISDEVTAEQTLEAMAVRNVKAAHILMPDLLMDDDTVTNERPLTRAEMERIALIAVQLGHAPAPAASSISDEKSTLTLDIDCSDFASL